MPRGGVKGNSGGKPGRSGRKSKAAEMGLQQLLDECFNDTQRRVVIKKLAQDCNSRDFKIRNESRKLLLAYTFGKPKEHHDVNISNFTDDDFRLLNEYELQRIIAGDEPATVFAAARARRIREAAKDTAERRAG